MKIIKNLVDLYIKSSIHIALAALALVQITKINLHLSTDKNLEYFIFFGTVFGYNLLKNFFSIKNKKINFKEHKPILVISLISLLLLIYSFLKIDCKLQINLISIGLLVLSYPYLRQFRHLKTIIVAICFSHITVYIPAMNQDIETKKLFILIIQRFLTVFCLTIPFEILDSKTDHISMNTIPQTIGVPNTKILGILILFTLIFLVNNHLIEYCILFVIAISILFSTTTRNSYYTLFWVEAIPILWWLLYLF